MSPAGNTIVFSSFYRDLENGFGKTDGATGYGFRLLQPLGELCRALEADGWRVRTRREQAPETADLAVFLDLDETLWETARRLPPAVPRILVSCESPIYAPFSHHAHVLLDRCWNAVFTWNRGIEAPHIIHYDLTGTPAAPGELPPLRANPPGPAERGVVVSSWKRDIRGLTRRRDELYRELARTGMVDLYGTGWPCRPRQQVFGPVTDKLATLARHPFAVVVENTVAPGYVTEKLSDCILAGIPAVYHGDAVTAARRYPGTFVALPELTVAAAQAAAAALRANYAGHLRAVAACRETMPGWGRDYRNAFVAAAAAIRRGASAPAGAGGAA